MVQTQVFDLEKIKELTSSIETLQASMYNLREITDMSETYSQYMIDNFTDEPFISQIEKVRGIIAIVLNRLEKVANDNITSFLDFQERLIKKYKENYQVQLKKIIFDPESLKNIGLYLIENRKISKTISRFSYVHSLEISQWFEILDSLKQNSLFLKTVKDVNQYYRLLIADKLKLELNKIPKDTDQTLIIDFKKLFLENPTITFNEYNQLIEGKLSRQELKTKKKKISGLKEREELERLKKRQGEQTESYDNYFKLSDREFERRIRKKSREGLKSIKPTSKQAGEVEISVEISEKIKKFKSQFDKSFEEKYLIKKDDELDPLDLIRERKIKKEKEYKRYKDHFENN
ncbi:MAG: hypothetical protein ACW986_00545 [Promethearchaeota archaeon]|jgi:hypothetical protein